MKEPLNGGMSRRISREELRKLLSATEQGVSEPVTPAPVTATVIRVEAFADTREESAEPETPPMDVVTDVATDVPVEAVAVEIAAPAEARQKTRAVRTRKDLSEDELEAELLKEVSLQGRAFGKVIQFWLKKGGLTQREATRRLGYVNPGVFNNRISGERAWKRGELPPLAQLVKRSLRQLRKDLKDFPEGKFP